MMLRQTWEILQTPKDIWSENVKHEYPLEILDADGTLTSKEILKMMLQEFKLN